MKKIYLSLLLIFFTGKAFTQTFCNSNGNVVIFSNYDGGILRINVDANIPNLKIGICGYENDSIIISGAYVGNVTQVIFAGYFNSTNVHCNPWPSKKSINGVASAITQINFMPPATYSNANGYTDIVCNYSCDITTNQGGCNTPDQIAAYFFSQFGSSNLLFHFTQYGCWTGSYLISAGGNCCAVPSGVGLHGYLSNENISLTSNPSSGKFTVEFNSITPKTELTVYDVLGNCIVPAFSPTRSKTEIDLSHQHRGVYFLRVSGKELKVVKLVVE